MPAIIHVIHSLFVGFRMDGTVASCGSSRTPCACRRIRGWLGSVREGSGNEDIDFDKAGLLTREEAEELNALANRLGAKRETDIIIVTTDNPDQEDVMVLTQNFYDEMAPGYDRPHGNAVILTVDNVPSRDLSGRILQERSNIWTIRDWT